MVLDGAGGLQKFIDVHRPDAIRRLDFPHAVAYLARAGQEAPGTGTAAMSVWLGRQAHALKHDGPDPVLALRTIVCADRWDEAWPQISPRLRLDAQPRRRAVRPHRRDARAATQAEPAPPPPPPAAPIAGSPRPAPATPAAPRLIVNARPTRAHPWNRRFLPLRPAAPAEN